MDGFLAGSHIAAFPIHANYPLLGKRNRSLFGFGNTLVTLTKNVFKYLYKFGKTASSIKYPDKKLDKVLGAMMRTQSLRGLDIPSEESMNQRNRDFVGMFTSISAYAITSNTCANNKEHPETYFKPDRDQVPIKGDLPAVPRGVTHRIHDYVNAGLSYFFMFYFHLHLISIYMGFSLFHIFFVVSHMYSKE